MGDATGISLAAIREQAQRVLSSPRFAHADRQRHFLEFIIEKVLAGDGAQIKEYLIAIEVYGRKPDYDPKVDSIVRVEAARVRSRLQAYYAAEGKSDPVVIELPKGSYVPVFHPASNPALETPELAHSEMVVSRRSIWRIASVVLLATLLGLWTLHRMMAKPSLTISIVPFTNLTPGSQTDLLAKALVKDLEAAFTQSGKMRVLPHGRSGQPPDLVLEGTIRGEQQGEQLRIVAQLLSSKDGGYIWSRIFDGDYSAIERQAELGKSIFADAEYQALGYSRQVSGTESPRSKAIELFRAARGAPEYDTDGMLVRGPATIERFPLSEINRSISLLERAVALDPTFALAYSSLGNYYHAAAEYDPRVLDKARESARRAVAIEPTLGEAHATLGYIYFLFDWKIEAAAAEYRAALDTEPRILTSYRLYADLMSILGRHDEGLRELERARAVYPNHPVIETSIGVSLFNGRRFQAAEKHARATLAKFPDFPLSHWILAIALEQLDRRTEAISEVETCLKMSPSDGRCTAAAGHLYAKSGRRADALAIIHKLQTRPLNQARANYTQALIHNALGDTEAAYANLDVALAGREFDCPYVLVEPRFANLRQQPRFKALIGKSGLHDQVQ